MEKIENSLVEWINANSGSRISSINEITSGDILLMIMHDVDRTYFAQIELNHEQGTWAEKANNLKTFMSYLDRFYSESLQVSRDSVVEDLDLTEIARYQNKNEIYKLMQVVIGAAIACDNKKVYVDRLMELDETVQADLMPFIQRVMDKIENKGELEERKEIQRLRHEQMRLHTELSASQQEVVHLEAVNSNLEQDMEELKSSNKKLMFQLANMENPTVREAAPILTSELEESFHEKLTAKDSELKTTTEQYTLEIQAKNEEISRLKDELDMVNEKVIALEKAQGVLDLYKKKLEEVSDMKQKNWELQEVNKGMKERLQRQDTMDSESSSVKQALAFYKEQLTAEKEKTATQSVQIENLKQQLEEDNARIADMEEKAKFTDEKNTQLKKQLQRDQLNTDLPDLDMSLSNMESIELEDRIRHLEAENDRLKWSSSSSLIVSELNDQVEQLLKTKSQSEHSMQQERNQLVNSIKEHSAALNSQQSQISQLEHDIAVGKTESQAHKDKIDILEKENTKLNASITEIDAIREEKNRMVSEMPGLYKNIDELKSKILEGKEETMRLNGMISENESQIRSKELEIERLGGKLKSALQNLEERSKEVNELKQSPPTLAPDRDLKVLELSTKVDQLESIIKTKDEQIIKASLDRQRLDEEMKSTMDGPTFGNPSEEMCQLTNCLTQKDHEINFLIKSKDEISGKWQREMRDFYSEVSKLAQDTNQLI